MKMSDAAKAFVEAKAAHDEASEALAVAKEALVKAMKASKKVSVASNGVSISMVTTTRTSYDLETLAELVSAPTFKKVTKPTVDPAALEAARAVGLISSDVYDSVVSTSEFVQVRTKSTDSPAVLSKKAS